jgi:soluble lytic murein transglycosylase-like protein
MKHRAAVAVLALAGTLAIIVQMANLPGERPRSVRPVAITMHQMAYSVAQEQAARVMVANGCPTTYAALAGREAVNNGLSPRVVAAVMFVESSCNPDAVSPAGAIGLLQINKHVWPHSMIDLRSPETNTQIGTRILASYVRAHGLREGLHRFNGLGENSDVYSTRVLIAAYRR